jgi:hypothetical protein
LREKVSTLKYVLVPETVTQDKSGVFVKSYTDLSHHTEFVVKPLTVKDNTKLVNVIKCLQELENDPD